MEGSGSSSERSKSLESLKRQKKEIRDSKLDDVSDGTFEQGHNNSFTSPPYPPPTDLDKKNKEEKEPSRTESVNSRGIMNSPDRKNTEMEDLTKHKEDHTKPEVDEQARSEDGGKKEEPEKPDQMEGV